MFRTKCTLKFITGKPNIMLSCLMCTNITNSICNWIFIWWISIWHFLWYETIWSVLQVYEAHNEVRIYLWHSLLTVHCTFYLFLVLFLIEVRAKCSGFHQHLMSSHLAQLCQQRNYFQRKHRRCESTPQVYNLFLLCLKTTNSKRRNRFKWNVFWMRNIYFLVWRHSWPLVFHFCFPCSHVQRGPYVHHRPPNQPVHGGPRVHEPEQREGQALLLRGGPVQRGGSHGQVGGPGNGGLNCFIALYCYLSYIIKSEHYSLILNIDRPIQRMKDTHCPSTLLLQNCEEKHLSKAINNESKMNQISFWQNQKQHGIQSPTTSSQALKMSFWKDMFIAEYSENYNMFQYKMMICP